MCVKHEEGSILVNSVGMWFLESNQFILALQVIRYVILGKVPFLSFFSYLSWGS